MNKELKQFNKLWSALIQAKKERMLETDYDTQVPPSTRVLGRYRKTLLASIKKVSKQ